MSIFNMNENKKPSETSKFGSQFGNGNEQLKKQQDSNKLETSMYSPKFPLSLNKKSQSQNTSSIEAAQAAGVIFPPIPLVISTNNATKLQNYSNFYQNYKHYLEYDLLGQKIGKQTYIPSKYYRYQNFPTKNITYFKGEQKAGLELNNEQKELQVDLSSSFKKNKNSPTNLSLQANKFLQKSPKTNEKQKSLSPLSISQQINFIIPSQLEHKKIKETQSKSPLKVNTEKNEDEKLSLFSSQKLNALQKIGQDKKNNNLFNSLGFAKQQPMIVNEFNPFNTEISSIYQKVDAKKIPQTKLDQLQKVGDQLFQNEKINDQQFQKENKLVYSIIQYHNYPNDNFYNDKRNLNYKNQQFEPEEFNKYLKNYIPIQQRDPHFYNNPYVHKYERNDEGKQQNYPVFSKLKHQENKKDEEFYCKNHSLNRKRINFSPEMFDISRKIQKCLQIISPSKNFINPEEKAKQLKPYRNISGPICTYNKKSTTPNGQNKNCSQFQMPSQKISNQANNKDGSKAKNPSLIKMEKPKTKDVIVNVSEVQYLRLKVKKLEQENKQYLAIIDNLSMSVKNLSSKKMNSNTSSIISFDFGSLTSSQNEFMKKKFENNIMYQAVRPQWWYEYENKGKQNQFDDQADDKQCKKGNKKVELNNLKKEKKLRKSRKRSQYSDDDYF